MIRPTSPDFYRQSIDRLHRLRTGAEELQSQVSTGTRLVRPSDDSIAAVEVRRIDHQLALDGAFAANRDRLTLELRFSENALSDISDRLIRARELSLSAANDTLTFEQRGAIATELEAVHAELIDFANDTTPDGTPLFGGAGGTTPYTLDANGHAVFGGNTDEASVAVADGLSLQRGVPGPQLFDIDVGGVPGNVFNVIRDTIDGLRDPAADHAAVARASVESLDTGTAKIGVGLAVVGARLDRLERLDVLEGERTIFRSEQRSELADVDLATALATLQQTILTLEASQASFTRLASISLFDQLR